MRTLRIALTLFITGTLFCGIILAQPKIPPFGTVVNEEITMQEYEKDKKAEAVVIYDLGVSRFLTSDQGIDIWFERTTKIKIFNKAGYKYTEISIPYYAEGGKMEKVYEIEAYTHNIDNGKLTRTQLKTDNIFDERVNERWRIKKFALPDVKEGSVVEYRYKLISPFIFNLQDWEFQKEIPVIYSGYETRMIPFYTYTYIFQGASKFDKFESYKESGTSRRYAGVEYNDMVYTFGMNHVPAFIDEGFITSKSDYIMKIDFQLSQYNTRSGAKIEIITTWPKLANDLIKDAEFGKYINASEKTAPKLLDNVVFSGKTDQKKIEAIVDAVKATFSWDGTDMKYAKKSLKDFMKEKSGSSANINLFLVGALKAAGMNAVPVLISTRSNGKIKTDYPFSHFFNAVIAMVKLPNGNMLLDATEPACPYYAIPVRTINDRGLVIVKDSDQWIDLVPNLPSSIQQSFHLEFQPDSDSILCKTDIRTTGYDAINYRKRFLNKQDEFVQYFRSDDLHICGLVNTNNYTETKLPYQFNFMAKTKKESIANKLYISPFLGAPVSENPFKQDKRAYPIDMIYSTKQSFVSSVQVPEGYSTEAIPKNYSFSNALADIELKATQEGNMIRIWGHYQFKKNIYNATDYPQLKYLYNEIIKVFNDKVVLVKEGA